MKPEIRKINLRIERSIENWEIYHALREIIANALDEQYITNSKDITIFKDEKNNWHIRDFGRGIKVECFTQDESTEKLSNPNLIGKFGVGLKEALATFDHNNVRVIIKSRHGLFTFGKSPQDGSNKIVTLISIYPPKNTTFLGTEFIFKGISDKDIEQAQNLFLRFSESFVLENAAVGQVLKKNGNYAAIYINGVQVAHEQNFLFSYNIIALDSKMLTTIYRERPYVGRSAYVAKVKEILVSCRTQKLAKLLINDMANYSQGTNHDELSWLEVQENAIKILNSFSKAIFLTPEDLQNYANLVDRAQGERYEIIKIPSNLKQRIHASRDITGTPIRDIDQFYHDYKKGFKFRFVAPEALQPDEREIFNTTTAILNLIGGKPVPVKHIEISEKMQKELKSDQEAAGFWDSSTGTIIINRSQLTSIKDYTAALLHELSHATSGAPDESRNFENELTKLLGSLSARLFEQKQPPEKMQTRFWHKFLKK